MTQQHIETKAKIAALARKTVERDIGTKLGADGATYGRT
jgi:hypothetical protein